MSLEGFSTLDPHHSTTTPTTTTDPTSTSLACDLQQDKDDTDDYDTYQMITLSSISFKQDDENHNYNSFSSQDTVLKRIYQICCQRYTIHDYDYDDDDDDFYSNETDEIQTKQGNFVLLFLWKLFFVIPSLWWNYEQTTKKNKNKNTKESKVENDMMNENDHNDSLQENSSSSSHFIPSDTTKRNHILGIPTFYGYDTTYIPYEAHVLARFWLTSTSTSMIHSSSSTTTTTTPFSIKNRNYSPHLPHVRLFHSSMIQLQHSTHTTTTVFKHPTTTSTTTTTLIIVDWGLIGEFLHLSTILSKKKNNDDDTDIALEYRNNNNTISNVGKVYETTDRMALLNQAHGNCNSPLLPSISLVRCCQINSNLIAISWGLDDGIIVLYQKRRIIKRTTTTTTRSKNIQQTLEKEEESWDSIAILTPTQQVVETTYYALIHNNSYLYNKNENENENETRSNKRPKWFGGSSSSSNSSRSFIHSSPKDELESLFESGLMRVSDIIPMSLIDHDNKSHYPFINKKKKKNDDNKKHNDDDENSKNTSSTNIILTVSRIGGCIEIFILPLDILNTLYEEEEEKSYHKTRRSSSHVRHYADTLPDLTLDPRCVVTPLIDTIDIHLDIMTLAIYPTYDESSPSTGCNFILACSGGKKEKDRSLSNFVIDTTYNECISYWNISLQNVSLDNKEENPYRQIPWALDIILMDCIEIKEKGPPVMVLSKLPMMKNNSWIQDRVSSSKKRSMITRSSLTAVILSTSPPVCSLRFHEWLGSPTDKKTQLPRRRLLLTFMDIHGGISFIDCSPWLNDPSLSSSSTYNPYHLPDFVMDRERFLSVLYPFVEFNRVVEYSVAYLSEDEVVLTVCTSAHSIFAIKCLLRADRPIEILHVKEIFKSETYPCRLLHASYTTNSQSSKDQLLLTMSCHSYGPDFNISLHSLNPMDIQSILDSHLRHGKYDKALALIEGKASRFFRDDVRDIIYKHMWEGRGDLTSLSKVSDSQYFIENVINIYDSIPSDKTIELDDLLLFYREALVKLESFHKAYDKNNSENTYQSQMRMLQYRLWCLHTLTYLPENFERLMTRQSIVLLNSSTFLLQIAEGFARCGEVRSLSIILARHWILLGSNATRMKLLQNLPHSIDVSLYAHLLPCHVENSSYAWKPYPDTSADDSSRILIDFNGSQILAYVKKLLKIDLRGTFALSGDELNPMSICEEISRSDLIRWYLERANAIFRYTCQLDMVIQFCDCISSRFSDCQDRQDPDFAKMWNQVLSFRAKSHHSLRILVYERLMINSDHRLPVSQLFCIETDDFLRHLVSVKGSAWISNELLKFSRLEPILPIAITRPSFSSEIRRKEVSDIIRFAINALKIGDSYSSNTYGNGNLFEAVELCVMISKASLPSIPLSERLISDDEMLENFILEVFSIMTTNELSPSLIASLWTLYENFPSNGDKSKNSCLDDIYRNLLTYEILLRWASPDSLKHFSLSSLRSTKLLYPPFPGCKCSIGYHITERMSNGVLRKIRASNDHDLRSLLVQFFADVMDLNEKCFDSSLSIDFIVEEFIFYRALNNHSFGIIRETMLLPVTFVRHSILCSYLHDFITQVASRGYSNETYKVLKDLRDVVGSDASPSLIEEMDTCIKYFDYCVFLLRQKESSSLIISYEDFRRATNMDRFLNVVKSSLVTWVGEHPEWSDPFAAADLNRNLFAVLFCRYSLDPNQVESHRYSIFESLSRLITLLGPLSRRESILLKCVWIKTAADLFYFGVANAASSILVHDITTIRIDDNVTGSIDEFPPIIGTIASILSMLMNHESIQDRYICYTVSIEFIHWCMTSFPMIEQLQLDPLILSLRMLEVNTAASSLGESFRAYQRFMIKFTSLSFTNGDCANWVPQELFKILIQDYVRRVFTAQGQMNDTAYSLSPSWPLEAVIAVGFKDTEIVDNFLDNQLHIMKELVKERSPFFMKLTQINITADEGIVKQLCGMGYSLFGAKKAASFTQNRSFRDALSWAIAHSNEKSFNEPMLLLESPESSSMDLASIHDLFLHLKSLRYSRMSRHIKVRKLVAPTALSLKTSDSASEVDSSGDDRIRAEHPMLLKMRIQLKQLGENERLRLKEEGRKLLEAARKAKGI